MAVTQRRTAFTAAVATAIALGATVLTLPARAAGEEPDAAAKSPTGFQLKDGALTWGIKESFRQYVTGDKADGSIRVADGAEQADDNGAFTFSGGKGSYDREKHSFTTAFKGSVRFLGHAKGEGKKKHWGLDLKFSDLKVIGEGEKGRVTADVTKSGKTRDDVTLATLDLAGEKGKEGKDGKDTKDAKSEAKDGDKAKAEDKGKGKAKDGSKSDEKSAEKSAEKPDAKDGTKNDSKNDVPSLTKVPVTLTAEGAKAFTYKGHSLVKAGASLDALSLSVHQGAPIPAPEPKPEPKPKPDPDKKPAPAPKPADPEKPKPEPKPDPEQKETPAPEPKPKDSEEPKPEPESEDKGAEDKGAEDKGVEDGKVTGPEDESLIPVTGDPKGGTEGTGGSSASPGTTGSTGTTGGTETPGTTGSPSESPKELAADSTIYDGRLDWGVKESFRTDISTKLNGKFEVSDGAQQQSTGFRFTKASGSYGGGDKPKLDATFNGTVRFTAHPANAKKVELTLSKFRIKADGTKGQLLAQVTKKTDEKAAPQLSGKEIALADLTLYEDSLKPVNGVVTLNMVQTALTKEGKEALELQSGQFQQGDGLDPVTAKIAVNKDAKLDDDSTGTNTDGSGSPSTGTGTTGTGGSSGTGTGTGSGTDDTLAHTGSDTPTGPLVGSAAALVLAGGAAVWTARRKSAKLAG
ncbi:HtaA domain-containing protein [Streptomyces huiliensis]|uniref:HtaA domain-containing protein n=1 Tax=Streptomyces huiliensis TaxID=2876027 RepID=UPI001CC19C00|nr:HtaA domain-containing protein [Streptomyces huiliensis]MBZ4318956.1 HtaA domain-containing protein [Streptomyces huiliensis]